MCSDRLSVFEFVIIILLDRVARKSERVHASALVASNVVGEDCPMLNTRSVCKFIITAALVAASTQAHASVSEGCQSANGVFVPVQGADDGIPFASPIPWSSFSIGEIINVTVEKVNYRSGSWDVYWDSYIQREPSYPNSGDGVFGITDNQIMLPTDPIGTTIQYSFTVDQAAIDSGLELTLDFSYAQVTVSCLGADAAEGADPAAEELERMVYNTISGNQQLVRDARERFMVATRQMAEQDESGIAVSQDIALDVTGGISAGIEGGHGMGSFYQQWGDYTGRSRTFIAGNFNFHWDNDGYVSNALSARLGRETIVTDSMMIGAFLALDIMNSERGGDNVSSVESRAASVGVYGVARVDEHMFVDAWASVGAVSGDVAFDEGASELTGDYYGDLYTVGASITGIIEQNGYEIWPTVEVAYGNATIDDYEVTGSETLSFDGSDVAVWRAAVTPEFRWAFDPAQGEGRILFAPSLVCEAGDGDATSCGGGARFGIRVGDEGTGSSTLFEASASRLGVTNTVGLQLRQEWRW